MSDSFDPYYIWLGIPPKDQPPNHYRLLGLQALEENTDVIDAAANRQTTYLHEMAAGPNRKESQQLLNEVAAARRCLLNPEKKNGYDEKLRADAAAAEAAVAPPVATAPPVAVPIARAVAPAAAPAPAPAAAPPSVAPAADPAVAPPAAPAAAPVVAPSAAPAIAPAVAQAVVPAVVPAEPPVDTGGSPFAEIPNFNFGDNAAEPAPVIDAGVGFPNLDTAPSNPVVAAVQQPAAADPNLSGGSAPSTGKKGVPKQWIIAGCSVVVVAIAAAVFSNGPESKTKSTPSKATPELDGSTAVVASTAQASPDDEPESSATPDKDIPKKKPSMFDQVSEQDGFFKVPTSFPGKEKKKANEK